MKKNEKKSERKTLYYYKNCGKSLEELNQDGNFMRACIEDIENPHADYWKEGF